MRDFRNAGSAWVVRAAGIAAAVTVAIGLFSTGAANADNLVPLPDGHIVDTGISIDSNHNSVLISPSLAANGAGREAWLTGNVTANVTSVPPGLTVGPNNGPINNAGTNNSSTDGAGAFSVGYL